MEEIKKVGLFFGKQIYKNYKKDDIDGMSAALTFFLIFSMFPVLVFISTVLGYLEISNSQVFSVFVGVLPTEVIEIILMYLQYLSKSANVNVLMVSLFFTVYFPLRMMDKMMEGINRAYQVESRRRLIRKLGLMLVLGFLFFLGVGLIFFLLIIGSNVLLLFLEYLPITMEFVHFWTTIRFFAMGMIAFFTLSSIYWLVPEVRLFIYEAMPGAVFASVGWLLFSAGFSFYVEHMGNYSVLYGSIGAIIILLIWLRAMVTILLLGAEINSVVMTMKRKREKPS